ncbi:hypothetical protein RhiLY_12157 [Ceratobasidium sp. AG-Ba]|nr:hypothetical protein RhiLY_12157 [Ceratobasidium sp. AG-Ba]
MPTTLSQIMAWNQNQPGANSLLVVSKLINVSTVVATPCAKRAVPQKCALKNGVLSPVSKWPRVLSEHTNSGDVDMNDPSNNKDFVDDEDILSDDHMWLSNSPSPKNKLSKAATSHSTLQNTLKLNSVAGGEFASKPTAKLAPKSMSKPAPKPAPTSSKIGGSSSSKASSSKAPTEAPTKALTKATSTKATLTKATLSKASGSGGKRSIVIVNNSSDKSDKKDSEGDGSGTEEILTCGGKRFWRMPCIAYTSGDPAVLAQLVENIKEAVKTVIEQGSPLTRQHYKSTKLSFEVTVRLLAPHKGIKDPWLTEIVV